MADDEESYPPRLVLQEPSPCEILHSPPAREITVARRALFERFKTRALEGVPRLIPRR